MSESIVLDPAEVATDRTELDLMADGIGILADGIDWGEAAIEQALADGSRGSRAVDFRVPNRKITIPLVVRAGGIDSFADARSRLQQKVGLIQREGGWLKRAIPGSPNLYLDLVNATLVLSGNWLQNMRGVDNAASLVLEAIPDFYEDEITLGDHAETTLPDLTFTESVRGDYPARCRIVVDEDQGVDQRGLLLGIRQRNYSSATTALLAYEAEALTALDLSATAALAGASGGGNNTMRNQSIASRWTPILSTDLSGTGPLTHRGRYRVWARAYTTTGNSTVTPPSVRLSWGLGGLSSPVDNPAVAIPAAGGFYALDLGEVVLDPPAAGTGHYWSGVISGKASSGSADIYLDRIWLQPLDEYATLVRARTASSAGLTAFVARDDFATLADDATLNGRTAPIGGTWASTANGAGSSTTDFRGRNGTIIRQTYNDGSAGALFGRTALLPGSWSEVEFGGEFSTDTWPEGMLVSLIARYVDANNWLMLFAVHLGSTLYLLLWMRLASTDRLLGYQPIVALPNTTVAVSLQVLASGVAAAQVRLSGSATPLWTISGSHSALATGGALASGKAGLMDYNATGTACTRTYDNLYAATATATRNAALFASTSAELRSDGIYRENPAGTTFGRDVEVVGDLPRLPASGMEGRPVELTLKPSRGDFETLPDSGIDDFSARVHYRPSWLFVAGE